MSKCVLSLFPKTGVTKGVIYNQGSLTFRPMQYCVTDKCPLDNMLHLWLVHRANMQLLTDDALPFENESSDVLLSLRLSELKRNKQHGIRNTVTRPSIHFFFSLFLQNGDTEHSLTPTGGTGGPFSLLVIPGPCKGNTTSGTDPVETHDNLQFICMYQQLTTNKYFSGNGNAHML